MFSISVKINAELFVSSFALLERKEISDKVCPFIQSCTPYHIGKTTLSKI